MRTMEDYKNTCALWEAVFVGNTMDEGDYLLFVVLDLNHSIQKRFFLKSR